MFPRRSKSRPTVPGSQNHVGPAPRARSHRASAHCRGVRRNGVLRLLMMKMSPTPGWPASRGTVHGPDETRSTGWPKRSWSCRISAVSNTMSPNAPQRITSGRRIIASLQLFRFVAARFRQLEQAAVADEMQRADDDQVVLVALQQLLDLRHPALVAIGDQRAIEHRRDFVFIAQERRELLRIAGAPRAEQRVRLAFHLVHFFERQVEELRLIGDREVREQTELLVERFEAGDFLVIRLGLAFELLLDALLRIEAELHVLQLRERHRHEPRLEPLQRFDRNAQAIAFLLDLGEARLADDVTERLLVADHAVLEHPTLRGGRIEIVEIDFHDERGRVLVGAIERRRQRRVLRAQKMDGSGEVDGVVRAVDRPNGRLRKGTQAAEQTEEGEEEPAADESTHTTSVSSEPSGRSSSVRYAGGRASTANSSAWGRNCAQVEGVAS